MAIVTLGLTSGIMPLVILAGILLLVFGLIKKMRSLIRIGLIVAVLAFLANIV